MGKTDDDLKVLNNSSREGSHEVLINQIKSFVESKPHNDRGFYILQLKRLRVKADYGDISIDYTKSDKSISLSKSTQQILNKCI